MSAEPSLDRDTKNAKIMLAVFGVLTLLFVCGGGGFVGYTAATGSETDAVNASMAAMGPGCCSLSGLLVALIAMFAFPTKKTVQLAAPIVAGVLGGIAGAGGLFIFMVAIFPSL